MSFKFYSAMKNVFPKILRKFKIAAVTVTLNLSSVLNGKRIRYGIKMKGISIRSRPLDL